ncbi:hypothetical protein BDF20DRAFT_816392 [Mycotypha africana]|uniref:uncharacterized protein n=1 Tax=Mycotypha africana TaxID=64632 RepID=UPI002300C46C|nr:uncharacterized protein BDF20DRAFT_816392 [Mycotypha africana]KAI8984085.1 hypothetical protein BDF20DRAFT_816392 [Mycotypha africana]
MKTAKSINGCPTLSRRPQSVITDIASLRVNEFDMIAGLGDSLMTGFASENVNALERWTMAIMQEHRGQSPIMGGDDNANTLANFLKHYNSGIVGASVGSHLASFCINGVCPILSNFWVPFKDNLNAAQTGAIAKNLDYELDYLIPRMKTMMKNNFEKSWKLVNIQIGSNDQCSSCTEGLKNVVSPEAYSGYVIKAIERIRNEVPRVLINLIGTFEVSRIMDIRAQQTDYCKPNLFTTIAVECSCLEQAEEGLKKMDEHCKGYNEQLKRIAEMYVPLRNKTFALTFNPAAINISSLPVDAISNIDCFHPNVKAGSWASKVFCPSENEHFFL